MTTYTNNEQFEFKPLAILILLFVVALALLTFFGCSTKKQITETREVEKVYIKDTVTRIETLRDTTYIIEQDKASITALLECDSNNKVILKRLIKVEQGRSIVPQIRLQHDTIILDCSKEAEKYKMYYKNIYLSEYSELKEKLSKEYNRETVKKTGMFYKMMFWISVIVIIVLLAWKILPKIFPQLKFLM